MRKYKIIIEGEDSDVGINIFELGVCD